MEIDPWDLLRRLPAALLAGVVGGLAAWLFAGLLPRSYTSVTTILPPKDLGSLRQEAETAEELRLRRTGRPANFATPSYLFATVLESRTMRDRALRRASLVGGGAEPREVAVSVGPEGVIRLAVTHGSPALARAVAAAYVTELKEYVESEALSASARARRSLESRLAEAEGELARLGPGGGAATEEETWDRRAELHAERRVLEARLGALTETALPDDPAVEKMRERLDQVIREERELRWSRPAPAASGRRAELEKVVGALREELWRARIAEERDALSVNVLDPPNLPASPSRPRRGRLGLLAGLLTAAGAWFFPLAFAGRPAARG